MFCTLCLSLELKPLEIFDGHYKKNILYFHCQNCDLIFLDQHFRMDTISEFDRYQMHENDFLDSGYQAFVSPLVEQVAKKIPLPAVGLDFGSGPDSAAGFLLRERSYKIEKYDPYYHPNESVLENQYDFLMACEVVEHFFTPAQEFERLRAFLKEKGSLFIMTSLWDSETDFSSWYYRRDLTHVSFYSKKSFEYIQRRFQFQVLAFPAKNLIELSLT